MIDSACMMTLAAGVENLPLLTTLAAGFAAAWVLGLLTQKLGLSPIVGYLLAGVIIGPHTPGFSGDVALSQQLAEIGVILLMFGVGMHFHVKDLVKVKDVSVPGAIGQSLVATLATMGLFWYLGWDLRSGAVVGMAMAVASTVVLLRVLMDRHMLNTSHGHVAVGWLIVEDILTVLLLVFIPIIASQETGGGFLSQEGLTSIGWAILKLAAMVMVVFVAGSRVVPWMLIRVARMRSPELFTLTVLVLSVTIAVGAAALFGASVALGAFLAGMVVAQSKVSHQAAADALPMRHAFAVLFFVSVGMMLDPAFLLEEPLLVAAGLAVVLVFKPLAAMIIVAVCGYPVRTGLTVAIGLSQIGEFSFIVAHSALQHKLIPENGMQLLVAVSMISIAINPLVFKTLEPVEKIIQRIPWLWKLLNARHDARVAALNAKGREAVQAASDKPLAIIAGYGPVGRVVDAMLRDAQMQTVIIDMNVETVRKLTKTGRAAIYGDATHHTILEEAGIARASHLVITLPVVEGLSELVMTARELNPSIEITVRTRYLAEGEGLRDAGVTFVVFEEGEVGVALARRVLERRNVDSALVERVLTGIRTSWRMNACGVAGLPTGQETVSGVMKMAMVEEAKVGKIEEEISG